MRRLKVGFIGVGKMGSCMAANLIKKGFKIWICDTDTTVFNKNGFLSKAQIADTPRELGLIPGLDAVISMLPDPVAVKEAYLNPRSGLFSVPEHSFHPQLLIDSSSIDPSTSREIAHAAKSIYLHRDARSSSGFDSPIMIDAPVSGGVPAAESASLTFMAGGAASDIEAVTPLLMQIGRRVIHCGPQGSGCAAKLANNLVLGIQMAAVAEGLAFGEKQGLDPGLLTSIFNSSSAHCWSSEKYNPVPGVMDGVPSSRGYQGGFSTSFMIKDLTLALRAAEQSHARVPLTKHAKDLYTKIITKGDDPNIDFSAIYEYVYRMNGEDDAAHNDE